MRDPADGPVPPSDPGAAAERPALRWLPAALFAALAAAFLVLASHQHPPAAGDSLGIAPAAINAANGRGLINDFWPQTMRYDASGQARFVYHGFLPVVAYAGALRCLPGAATAPAAFLVNGLFQVAALGACWWAWAALFAAARPPRRHDRLLLAAGLLACATPLLGWGFRPETVTCLLVALGLRAVLAAAPRWRWVVGGAALGVVAAAHPAAALVLGWGLLLALGLLVPGRAAWRAAAEAVAAGALALGALLSCYPFPLADLAAGLLANLRASSSGGGAGPQVAAWMSDRETTMLGALALLAVVLGVRALVRARGGRHPLLAALAALGLLLALARTLHVPGFLHSAPPRTYNALALLPVWLGLTLLACRAPPGAAPRAGRTLAAAALVASAGLGFCYQAVAWTWTRAHAATLAEARATLAGLLAEGPGPVAVSPLFWCASEDYPRLRCWEDQGGEAPRAAVVMLQQAFRSRQEPPALPGYRLVADRFARGRPELAGVPLANTWGGYGFAIYRREP